MSGGEENGGWDVDANDANPPPGNDGAVAPTACEVLEHVVRWVVENPNEVVVEAFEEGHTVRLEVAVSPDDVGRVIGRRGRVANAIRTVVRAAAVNDGRSVDVAFLEP